MIGAWWTLALAAAAPSAEKAPEPPHAELQKLDDGTRIDLKLDGPVLGLAVARREGDRRWVLVLVGRPEPQRGPTPCGVESAADAKPRGDARLFGWNPDHPETLSALGRDLPEGAIDTADLDGNGVDEIVLFGETGIAELLVDAEAGTTTVRELLAGRYSQVWDEEGRDPALRAVSIGALATYRRGEGEAIRPVSDLELPIVVSRRGEGVHVRTTSFLPVDGIADGRVRFVAGLERIPDLRRVRTLLLDPEGPAESRVIEAWARFPSRERALENEVALLDGSPVLIVLTTPADKLSLFGEKLLRVFPLAADRTRSGHPPLLADETGINLWQGGTPEVLDLDGDGRDDLVLAYWKGLKDSIAALEVRKRLPDGSFAHAKTFDFDVKDGDRGWTFYGRDLDGDGRPDLALRAEGAFLVYPGSPGSQAIEHPVAKVPSRRIPLASDAMLSITAQSMSFGPQGLSVEYDVDARLPRFLDLDGDGRVEAILAGGSGAAGRVVIVRFR